MAGAIDRRELLQAGGLALGAALLPGGALAAESLAAPGVILVDPDIPAAADIARAARAPGQRLAPLVGDPTRIWPSLLASAPASLSGVTRWSDFVLLRELAHAHRRRVRRELHHAVVDGPLLVSWTFA